MVIVDGPASSTTASGGPTTTASVPISTAAPSSSTAPTTAETAEHRSDATTETTTTTDDGAAVEAIGEPLLAALFGDDRPPRVVVLHDDVLEEYRADQSPFVRLHPLVGPWATVAADWISRPNDDGTRWAAPLISADTLRQIPDGWWLTEWDGGAVIVPSDCIVEPIPSVELRTVYDLALVTVLDVLDLAEFVDGGCFNVYLRGSAVLSIVHDAEGNAGAVATNTGLDLTGGDYVGYYVLDPTGRRFVYTDQASSPSPHVGYEIVMRDTSTGAELGRWSTERGVTTLEASGRWILARVVEPDSFDAVGWISIDTSTGRQRFAPTQATIVLPSP